jgi:Mn-containing catalase
MVHERDHAHARVFRQALEAVEQVRVAQLGAQVEQVVAAEGLRFDRRVDGPDHLPQEA